MEEKRDVKEFVLDLMKDYGAFIAKLESTDADLSMFQGKELDSVMNYPLRWAVLDFLHFRADANELRNFFIKQKMNYPTPIYYSLMNLLASHDVDRILTALSTPVTLRNFSREEQLEVKITKEFNNCKL